ncbi:hypothetical protein Pelo_17887 [Pelomyxa schiedti]|nr:hypothetical protein Pelo_17887 [Pelomyxa schiedti]
MILTISRVAWDYALAPVLTRTHDMLTRDDVVWAFGVTNALFPLVVLVCKAVADAPAVLKYPGDTIEEPHSKHWDVKCAGLAGSPSCISWILRHKSKRNNTRECLSVLWGLCGGGHLEMAKQLVDAGRSYGRGGGAGDADLAWWVRGSGAIEIIDDGQNDVTLMSEVCRGGHLETAKWVVSKFRIRESWELAAPFVAAVAGGKMEVAQWLLGSFGVGWAINILGFDYPVEEFYFGGNLEMLKWLLDVFPETWALEEGSKARSPVPLAVCVMNNHKLTLKERIEAFQWLKSRFHFDQQAIQVIYSWTERVESLKWLMETHGAQPTGTTMSQWWWEPEGVESVEWLVEHFPMAVTPTTFVEACANIKDDLHCIQLLSQGVDLTPTITEKALLCALRHCRVQVANWLEATFHVMEKNVGADPEKANSTLIDLCKSYEHPRDTRGIKWLFQHIPVSTIEESTVSTVLCHSRSSVLSFLMSLFNISGLTHSDDNINKIVETTLTHGWNPLIAQIISQGYLKYYHVTFYHGVINCSKAFKRLFDELHIAETHFSTHMVLLELVNTGHTGLTEWFIKRVNVTSDQLPETTPVSFQMWKMLLHVFPDMTGQKLLTGNLRFALVLSPTHAEHAMRNHGITLAGITPLLLDLLPSPILNPLPETRLWARQWLSSTKKLL